MERTRTTILLAVAGGPAVASVYYAPPLLDVMAAGFGMSRAIAVHVANQTVVQQGGDGAPSRLTAVYMIFYSIGSAAGAAASTAMYATAGWTGVCALGAGISLVALVFPLLGRTRHDPLPHGRRHLLPRGR